MVKTIFSALAMLVLSFNVTAQEKELLRIIGDSKEFVVQTKNGPFVITRTMTPCAKNKGWLHPKAIA
jgi:hypothetical protein